MNVRLIIVLVVGCMATLGVRAESPQPYLEKAFALDIGLGSNIDLASLDAVQKEYLATRKSAVFQLDLRASYFFVRHWGAYADLRNNFFHMNVADKIIDRIFPLVGSYKPSISIGGIYRYEPGRWQLQPRLGIGMADYGYKKSSSEKNGVSTERKLTTSSACIDAGVSLAYRTSRICSLFVDAEYLQPLKAAKYRRTITDADGNVTRTEVKAPSYLRSMSISAGIRFQTGSK